MEKRSIFSTLVLSSMIVAVTLCGCSRAKVESIEHMNKGVEYYTTKQYNMAIKELEKAIQLDDENEEAYHNLAIVHIEQGHWQKSAQLLTRAAALNPENATYQFLLGQSYMELGELEQAKNSLQNAANLDPNFYKPSYFLGLVNEQLDEPQQALQAYTDAAMKNGRFIPAYTGLANLYIELGYVDHAKQVLEEALKVVVEGSEEHAEVEKLLGTVYQEKDDPETAIVHLKKAVDIEPDMLDAVFNLGWTYAEIKSNDNAQLYLERFIKQAGEDTPQEYVRAAQSKIYEFKEEPLASQ
jgi:tetratricopeptide (TPR) repeat protein